MLKPISIAQRIGRPRQSYDETSGKRITSKLKLKLILILKSKSISFQSNYRAW